jgi:hypothetical protein
MAGIKASFWGVAAGRAGGIRSPAARKSHGLVRLLWAVATMALLTQTTATGTKISCAVPGQLAVPNPNACSAAKSATGEPLPNCVNIGPTDDAPEWVCAACSHNCDCGPGEYCPKGPGQFTGTCRKIALDDKIGRGCVRFGYPHTPGWEMPVLGVNEHLACGAPVFNKNGTFVRYDWIGACIRGVCSECEGGPMAWSLSTSVNSVAYTGAPAPVDPTDAESHRARDGGTLSCPGTFCQYGTISRNGSWILDVLPYGIQMAILAFIILIFFAVSLIVLVQCGRSAGVRALMGKKVRVGTDYYVMQPQSRAPEPLTVEVDDASKQQ